MKRNRPGSQLLAIGASLLALTVVSVAGSNDCGHSAALPTTDPYRCYNCHGTAAPNRLDLNPFGRDFAANGHVWNADLAAMDSDEDVCSNGFELGDSDGNGVMDGHATQQGSNPGVPDCSGGAFNDPVTWGTLKSLFQR